jgi:hypothetical protein
MKRYLLLVVKPALGKAGVLAAILLALMAFAPQAEAIVANGGTISYLGSGDVTVTFLESEAAYRSYLVLYTASDLSTVLTPPGTPCGGCPTGGLFNSDTTPLGTTFVLTQAFLQAHFGAGDEMVFAIQVDQDLNGSIDRIYYMGAAGRNPDGFTHNDTQPGGPQLAIVGFEDIFGGGDLDYNDHVFSFFPVFITPNPGGLLLVGVSLIGFALADWKRRRR